VVARLHADPVFRADIDAARKEYAALHANGILPARDCRAEAEALALAPPSLVRRNGN
jgi:acid phosphatase (class A)